MSTGCCVRSEGREEPILPDAAQPVRLSAGACDAGTAGLASEPEEAAATLS